MAKRKVNDSSKASNAVTARVSSRRIGAVLKRLAALYPSHPLHVDPREPFQVLVGGMLSSRTQDPVTNATMERLWQRASTPKALLSVPEDELAAILKPVGFYRTKARHLHGICRLVLDDFNGKVPESRDELMQFPGVGRKVANLVLNICFAAPVICVDTHVHRIAGRLGWTECKTPEQTELALMELVQQHYWTSLNRVLVNHGQQVCSPQIPRCSECDVVHLCQRCGVIKSK